MVNIRFHPSFRKALQKTDDQLRLKVLKQIKKISENPNIGKPMRYNRKGTREVYIPPLRISYIFEEDVVKMIALYHKDDQ